MKPLLIRRKKMYTEEALFLKVCHYHNDTRCSDRRDTANTHYLKR